MKKIGMIGLGKMGHSIAKNIMGHDLPMVLYDVRPEAFADLVADGAEQAQSIQSLGEQVETVLLMVNTYPQCQSCMTELLQTMKRGTIIVSSTIAMDQVQALGKMAAEHGLAMLDAPVSGGTAGAEQGTLTIMVGGPKAVYEEHLPLLNAYGSNVVHVGELVGHGQAVKAVNQLLVGIHMCAAAEAFTMARACGLDLNTMFQTVKASAGNSRIFENRGQFFIDRDFNTRSNLAIQQKDTQIACATAEQAGAPALLGELSLQLFRLAGRKYDPSEDSIAVVKLLEEMAGMEI